MSWFQMKSFIQHLKFCSSWNSHSRERNFLELKIRIDKVSRRYSYNVFKYKLLLWATTQRKFISLPGKRMIGDNTGSQWKELAPRSHCIWWAPARNSSATSLKDTIPQNWKKRARNIEISSLSFLYTVEDWSETLGWNSIKRYAQRTTSACAWWKLQ